MKFQPEKAARLATVIACGYARIQGDKKVNYTKNETPFVRSKMVEALATFRNIYDHSNGSPLFRRVVMAIDPSAMGKEASWVEVKVAVLLGVEAHLLVPLVSNQEAISASLLIRNVLDAWILEAEVGWWGQGGIWQPIGRQVKSETTVESALGHLPELLGWLSFRFEKELERLERLFVVGDNRRSRTPSPQIGSMPN
jgi:hypothetical protein